MPDRPLLIVGDVQGDVERLREALLPYPQDEVDTVFVGDFFQGGVLGAAGGAAAARLAAQRRNARSVLGNHDVFLLCVLQQERDGWSPSVQHKPEVVSPKTLHAFTLRLAEFWLQRRGDWADLRAVARDHELERWLRALPLMLRLEDGTLIQHCDGDTHAELGDDVAAVNARTHELMRTPDGTWQVFWHTVARRAFDDEARLDAHLRHFGARRVVHGHTPHRGETPGVTHGGRAWSFDGCFSRYWQGDDGASVGPIAATVALLPPLQAGAPLPLSPTAPSAAPGSS